jgi:hypothetical protein
MPDWNSRLVVKVDDTKVTPIDSFSPSFSLGAEALHSIEQTHVGVIYSTKQITFSMTVKAIGTSVAKLTELAMNGTRFSVALQESEDGNDWSFESIVLTECIITSCSPSPANVSGAPAATFSGFSLSSTVTPASSDVTAVTIP